ncbi:MAG: hypothetical protein PVSMB8_11230 [Vulcanimicrobiaceae bacterium]
MSTTSRDLATKAMRRTVGVRDAKARLSELLRDAQLGHEWTITERGKPIARIVPIAAQPTTLEERMQRLVANGVIDAAPLHLAPLPPPLRVPVGIARRMLDDDRNA